jgi:bacterioferritin
VLASSRGIEHDGPYGRSGEEAMKGNKKMIEALNDILTGELTGVNQYFVHYKMCANWGYERLAKKSKEESFGEMKHADELIERVLFLDGVPNLQRLWKVNVGETVPEQLKLDLELEMDAVKRLNEAIKLAGEVGDNGSRDLLEDMLEDEEEHVDWLESQLHQLEQLGEKLYLSQQIHDDED